jgi:hypothetical protein
VREFINATERFFVLCNKDKIFLADILYYRQKTESKIPVSDFDSESIILVEVGKENIEKAFENFYYQIPITAGFQGPDCKHLGSRS